MNLTRVMVNFWKDRLSKLIEACILTFCAAQDYRLEQEDYDSSLPLQPRQLDFALPPTCVVHLR